jgi:multidrug resistance efflux pump
MKSLNFQRNKALFRVTNEQEIKKHRNWDRLVYIALLIALIVFLAYWLLNKAFVVHAYGHVIIESSRIRLTDDARLEEVYVQEGDSVLVGDTLFTYSLDLDHDINGTGGSGASMSIGGFTGRTNADNWWLKEIYNIKKTVAINNVKITENNDLIKNFQGELKRLTNEVILDVMPKQRLDYLQTEIVKLKADNQKINQENNELHNLMRTLKPFENSDKPPVIKDLKLTSSAKGNFGRNNMATNLLFSGELLSESHYFTAPMDGIVTRIYINSTETALKSEDIMALHKDRPAYIKAYFEQEDLANFKIDDVFKVRFPDGTVSYGTLKRFYIATYVLPEEFQKKYEPTTRVVAADIYPLNEEDLRQWKAFYKMGVDISKFKY